MFAQSSFLIIVSAFLTLYVTEINCRLRKWKLL